MKIVYFDVEHNEEEFLSRVMTLYRSRNTTPIAIIYTYKSNIFEYIIYTFSSSTCYIRINIVWLILDLAAL